MGDPSETGPERLSKYVSTISGVCLGVVLGDSENRWPPYQGRRDRRTFAGNTVLRYKTFLEWLDEWVRKPAATPAAAVPTTITPGPVTVQAPKTP